MTNLKRFAIGVASAALVAGMGIAPAVAADPVNTLPGVFANSVDRLAGLDRIDTSMEVARHEFTSEAKQGNGTKASVAYIVNSAAMVDAATAGMLTDGPVILVDNNRRTASIVGKFLKNSNEANGGVAGFKGITTIYAIGGTSAVSDDTLSTVAEAAGVAATLRIDGKDRYETSANVAERIYSQALKNEKYANNVHQGVGIDRNGNRLAKLYLANGADSHVVDAMAAGVLDDGPILYVNPDGTIPEVVANFIKKTLPKSWGVLGGQSAVSDETASTARAIAVYKNDWSEAYDVPALRNKVKQLKVQVNGNGMSRLAYSPRFMGYNKTYAEANAISGLWSAAYAQAVANVNNAINSVVKSRSIKPEEAKERDFNITDGLKGIYGTFVGKNVESYWKYFTTDDEGYINGFDFERFESVELKKTIKDAKDDLNRVWGMGDQEYRALKDAVAKATQNAYGPKTATNDGAVNSSTNPGPNFEIPLAAVNTVSKYVVEAQATLLQNAKKELADTQNLLAVAENKIQFTVEGRLGGADRYATAAAVAQYWADQTHHVFSDVYVADGNATADALVAGQLTRGPLLLVASGQDVPEATKSVARALHAWKVSEGAAKKTVYGVGGEAVLADKTLTDLYNEINAAAKGYGSGTHANKLSVDSSSSVLNVIAGSKDGKATFTWDGLSATDLDKTSVLCDNAVYVGVNKTDGACTFAAAGVKGVKIDSSKVQLVNNAVSGTITVPVEYRGETVDVTFNVYSAESDDVTVDLGGNTDPKVAELNRVKKGYIVHAVTITKPTNNADKTVVVKKVESSREGTNATASLKGSKLVLNVYGSDKWEADDKITVTLVNTEPGKAPKEATVTVTVQA